MKKDSIWFEGLKKQEFPFLKKDLDIDILIIGGGIAGISTLFELKNNKEKIVLIDSEKIGHGKTAYSTGKLTFLQDINLLSISDSLIDNYLKSQIDAINIVKNNVINYSIKCDFEGVNSSLFVRDKQNLEKLLKVKSILDRNNIKNNINNENCLFDDVSSLVVNNTAVFNPLKYIYGLCEILSKYKNVTIYESTVAVDVKHDNGTYLVRTKSNIIKCKKLIITCHYPFFLFPSLIPLNCHLERSYLCSSVIKKGCKESGINLDNDVISYRYLNKNNPYLIYLSGTHKLGNKLDYSSKYEKLIEDVSNNTLNITNIWQNDDLITNDYLPFIGRIKKDNNSLLIGCGFNTWGLTNGVITGKILSSIINNEENEYEKLFSLQRPITITKAKNFLFDAFLLSKNYIISKTKNNYNFYNGEVKITYHKGKKVGIYKDDENKYHIVSLLCPHLKCNLTFNMYQKTWDCPCHGSRFDIKGNVIDGPSLYNIKISS